MDESDESLLPDDSFYSHHWDCDGCPPPYFDLPPPPRPAFLENPDYCADDKGGGGGERRSPYESCDNPIIIDSHLLHENDLLNILLIVIASVVVVLIILFIACIIWRKRVSLLNSLPLRGKPLPRSSNQSIDLAPPLGRGVGTAAGHGIEHYPNQKTDFGNFPSHFLARNPIDSTQQHGINSFELTEHPSRHVYNNPNYPTLEIGGLPFYLMPSASNNSPSDKDTSLTVGNNASGQSNSSPLYEQDYVPSSSQKSIGPIYEDIDRMCTYRGAPPDPLPQPRQTLLHPATDERTYYNVFPAGANRLSCPNSDGSSSSPHHCGTSSSEVSFDSGSSPRHGVANPIINSRIRALSPTQSERTRSPNSVYSARLASSKRSPSSAVYYYSDTLRPRQNRAFVVDSDSGISNSQDVPRTPPPPPPPPLLPSARLAAANEKRRTASSSRERGGKGRKTSTESSITFSPENSKGGGRKGPSVKV